MKIFNNKPLIKTELTNNKQQRVEEKKVKRPASAPIDINNLPKIRNYAIAALFLLPTLGIVKNCSCSNVSNNQGETPQEIIIEGEPTDTTYRAMYTDKTDMLLYTVKKGDTPSGIAEKHNVSTRRLLDVNGLNKKSVIYPDETLIIPESYRVKNIRTAEDVAKMLGLSTDYIEFLQNIEEKYDTVYEDRNKKQTIGVGHLILPKEKAFYKNKKLDDKEIYTLLAQDILNIDLDLKTVINENAYKNMPRNLKESVIDLAFNKGIGAISDNTILNKALNDEDYVTAVANLTQDYSVINNNKGEKIKKPAAGLSKRRLYNIANANQIFKNGIPEVVTDSAAAVYRRGLKYLEAEKNRGELTENEYKGVLKEFDYIADELFEGKIKDNSSNRVVKIKRRFTDNQIGNNTAANSSQVIYVNGQKTNWTVSSLYEDWNKTAKRNLRPQKRPLPQVDKNGNIKALVKIYKPTGEGLLSGKTIIVNPGHGGAMNKVEKNGKLNVNFDPGTSNAVMSKRNPNIETKSFIGNGGIALEEWVVNQNISDELTKLINKAGGKVIYVQGSVYSAMEAIREIENTNKIDLLVSLHSNSIGAKRGIYVISNKRNGTDEEDKTLADSITTNLNQNSWFKGITHQKEQSLGVLSSSSEESSPIPGVLIETGNLKNKDDVANLASQTFKNKLVESILNGIIDYLH